MACSFFKNTRSFLRRFKDDTQGSMTIFGLFFFLVSGILGAIALDVAALYADRNHLQIAADQAAHAALYNRRVTGDSAADAKTKAINLVNVTLPSAKYGVSLEPGDIIFGTYDEATGEFSENAASTQAARAITSFEGLNAAQTYLFRLIGIDAFDIYADAIYITEGQDCFTDGFVSDTHVGFQNNTFIGEGMCIHSNGTVGFQPNNDFEPGSIVNLQEGNLVIPDDKTPDDIGEEGFELSGVLGYVPPIELRVLDRVNAMVDFYNGEDFATNTEGDDAQWPDYIATSDNKVPAFWESLPSKDVDVNQLSENTAYYVTCSGTGNDRKLTINAADANSVLSRVLLVTNCQIEFGSNVHITESRIVSTYTGSNGDSIKAAAGLMLGTADPGRNGCDLAGSGVQLVAEGDIQIPGRSTAYGSQIFTKGNITITSATQGGGNSEEGSAFADYVGTSIVAQGSIDIKSNMTALAGCNGDGDKITAAYFRLVN